MSNYCNQKGMICHNCNEYGSCQVTGCSYPDAITAIKMDSPMDEEEFLDKVKQEQGNVGYIKVNNFDEMEKYRMARSCQICGEPTESLDDYICPECKKRLKNLLYGEHLFTSRFQEGKEIMYTVPTLEVKERGWEKPIYDELRERLGICND